MKQPDPIIILRNVSLKSHSHARPSCIIHAKLPLSALASWSTIRGGQDSAVGWENLHFRRSDPLSPSARTVRLTFTLPITEPKVLVVFLR